MRKRVEKRGNYFLYCQFCEHDGNCELRHHEFLGLPSSGKVDRSPYQGHEALAWHFATFQRKTARGGCNGRILENDNCFLPLQCECGTVIGGVGIAITCAKLTPNSLGRQRIAIALEIASRKGISLEEVDDSDLPPIDHDYPFCAQF